MELISGLLFVTALVIFGLFLLCIMLISVVYILGYIYDSVFGSSLIRIGYFIGSKYPKIKKIELVNKFWKQIQPKELYLRYETPLFTYCFSYTAISLLSLLMPDKNNISVILASGTYMLFYFVGMARKCRGSKDYYKKVLENNFEFLKLSFLPLGFVITVLGFLFTITGVKVQDIVGDIGIVEEIYMNLLYYNSETAKLWLLLKMITLSGLVVILFYVLSLPIQVISFFVISIIFYFGKHKDGYKELFKRYGSIVGFVLEKL